MRLVRRTHARTPLVAKLATLACVASGAASLAYAYPALAGASGGATRSGGGTSARAARTLYLRETASLHMVHGKESSIGERGSAWGTFNAPLSAQLTVSAEHVSAIFTIYPHGGSITGKASARFEVRGHTAYYGGTLNITHGTGAYRHASGSNLGISGTIDRFSFALTVKANGWMKL